MDEILVLIEYCSKICLENLVIHQDLFKWWFFFILTIRLTWESIDSVRRKRFDHFNVHIMIRQFSIFWLKYSVYWLFFTRIYFITDNLRNFKNILRINPRLRFWKEDNFECWKFANIIQLYFQCRCRFSLYEPYNILPFSKREKWRKKQKLKTTRMPWYAMSASHI